MSRWLKVVLGIFEGSIFLAGSVGVAQCGAEGGTAVCCQGHLRRTRCVCLLAHRLWQTLPFVMDYKRSQTVQEARERGSAIIVVSPLVTLMEDQVSGLRKHGVKASIITSSASVTREHISTGSLATDNVFFCAPEVLVASKWRDAFERPEFSGRIVAVVVDEAHCVSKW